jgi:hypothetical protein
MIQQPGEHTDKVLALARRRRCEQFILGVGQQDVEPQRCRSSLPANTSGDRLPEPAR